MNPVNQENQIQGPRLGLAYSRYRHTVVELYAQEHGSLEVIYHDLVDGPGEYTDNDGQPIPQPADAEPTGLVGGARSDDELAPENCDDFQFAQQVPSRERMRHLQTILLAQTAESPGKANGLQYDLAEWSSWSADKDIDGRSTSFSMDFDRDAAINDFIDHQAGKWVDADKEKQEVSGGLGSITEKQKEGSGSLSDVSLEYVDN